MPALYARLAALPRAAVLELPISDEADSVRQWWSVHHGLDLVNGVGAFRPDRYLHLSRLIAREWEAGAPGSLEDTTALRYLKHHFPIGYVVVHAQAPPALRERASRTPSLEPLFEEQGARVYRLRRSGDGRVLRRAFRDDQLEEGLVAARLRGAPGSSVRATFNGGELGSRPLDGAPRAETWTVGPAVRRGLNTLVLTGEPEGSAFELLDVSAR